MTCVSSILCVSIKVSKPIMVAKEFIFGFSYAAFILLRNEVNTVIEFGIPDLSKSNFSWHFACFFVLYLHGSAMRAAHFNTV